jgi:hypothetical protein
MNLSWDEVFASSCTDQIGTALSSVDRCPSFAIQGGALIRARADEAQVSSPHSFNGTP